jgi:hypothetical protein
VEINTRNVRLSPTRPMSNIQFRHTDAKPPAEMLRDDKAERIARIWRDDIDSLFGQTRQDKSPPPTKEEVAYREKQEIAAYERQEAARRDRDLLRAARKAEVLRQIAPTFMQSARQNRSIEISQWRDDDTGDYRADCTHPSPPEPISVPGSWYPVLLDMVRIALFADESYSLIVPVTEMLPGWADAHEQPRAGLRPVIALLGALLAVLIQQRISLARYGSRSGQWASSTTSIPIGLAFGGSLAAAMVFVGEGPTHLSLVAPVLFAVELEDQFLVVSLSRCTVSRTHEVYSGPRTDPNYEVAG